MRTLDGVVFSRPAPFLLLSMPRFICCSICPLGPLIVYDLLSSSSAGCIQTCSSVSLSCWTARKRPSKSKHLCCLLFTESGGRHNLVGGTSNSHHLTGSCCIGGGRVCVACYLNNVLASLSVFCHACYC